jgi:hypothetical protein
MKEKRLKISVHSTKEILLILFVICILITAFALIPLPGGDDWEHFRGASQRILKGTPLYGEKVTHGFFSNPPWVALILLPISLLPFHWGWATVITLSACLLIILCHHWRFGILKAILVLLSPASFYIFLHGGIDVFVLAGILLPRESWYIVAVSKPQVAIGLIFGVDKDRMIKAIIITLLILLLSILFFGFWPLEIFRQGAPFINAPHNIWAGLWPFQVPAGLMLLLLGIRRKDEKLLIASSPILSPYAAISSMLGPWMALVSYLRKWEVVIIFIAWWGAVIYRLLGFY